MATQLRLTSGTHTFTDQTFPEAQSVLYLGRAACEEGVSSDEDVVDPKDAESGDVVGFSHCTPADTDDGSMFEDTVADGIRLIVDGVECVVGTHDYQDDGLAVAVIRRAWADAMETVPDVPGSVQSIRALARWLKGQTPDTLEHYACDCTLLPSWGENKGYECETFDTTDPAKVILLHINHTPADEREPWEVVIEEVEG